MLDGWFETGSEGVCWILDRKLGSKTGETGGLVFIKFGDRLKVWGEDGRVVFDDMIIPDFKTGWKPYPANPKEGQQQALGYWIHWVQTGWQPDAWASLFIKHLDWAHTREQKVQWKDCRQLRAELTKNSKKTL